MDNITSLNLALNDKKTKLGAQHSIILANLGCMMAYNFWKKTFPILALDNWQNKLTQSNYIQIMGRSSRGGPSKPKTFGLYSAKQISALGVENFLLSKGEYEEINI